MRSRMHLGMRSRIRAAIRHEIHARIGISIHRSIHLAIRLHIRLAIRLRIGKSIHLRIGIAIRLSIRPEIRLAIGASIRRQMRLSTGKKMRPTRRPVGRGLHSGVYLDTSLTSTGESRGHNITFLSSVGGPAASASAAGPVDDRCTEDAGGFDISDGPAYSGPAWNRTRNCLTG